MYILLLINFNQYSLINILTRAVATIGAGGRAIAFPPIGIAPIKLLGN